MTTLIENFTEKDIENFYKLELILPNILEMGEGIHVLRSDIGFLDFIVHIIKKEEDKILVDFAHYIKRETQPGIEMCYPEPHVEAEIYPKLKAVKGTSFKNKEVKVTIYNQDGSEKIEQASDICSFLSMWFENVLDQGHQLIDPPMEWERKPQEFVGERYLFKGRFIVTRQVATCLPAEQRLYILLDILGFAKANKNCDYLQCYEKDGQKIYVIDQLSISMLEGDGYTEEQKKEYNYCTMMFSHEY